MAFLRSGAQLSSVSCSDIKGSNSMNLPSLALIIMAAAAAVATEDTPADPEAMAAIQQSDEQVGKIDSTIITNIASFSDNHLGIFLCM